MLLHDVRTGKSGHGMVHPAWIEVPQVGAAILDSVRPLIQSNLVVRDYAF
jgi:hypothetical protein